MMREWARDENIWRRRASLLCQLGFKEDTDLALLYDCIGAWSSPNTRRRHWTLLTKVETSCDRILIAGGANVEAEWEQGPAV